MKRYRVIFEESAQENVRECFDWGCRALGKRTARQWARELRSAAAKQLGVVPKGFPLAPENEEFFRRDSSNGSRSLSCAIHNQGS